MLMQLWARRRHLIFWPLRAALPLGGEATMRDLLRQIQPRLDLPLPDSYSDAQLNAVLGHRPFRSILYHRLRAAGPKGRIAAKLLSRLYPGEPALFITCDDIGPG